MTDRHNCWECMSCGRQPGGRHVDEFGVCPAATEARVHGMNGGVNGGRACWAVAGTLCGGRPSGLFSAKGDCITCGFYKKVVTEELPDLAYTPRILSRLSLDEID